MCYAVVEFVELGVGFNARSRGTAFQMDLPLQHPFRSLKVELDEPQNTLFHGNSSAEAKLGPHLVGASTVDVGKTVVPRDVLDRRLGAGVASDLVDQIVDWGRASGCNVEGIKEGTRCFEGPFASTMRELLDGEEERVNDVVNVDEIKLWQGTSTLEDGTRNGELGAHMLLAAHDLDDLVRERLGHN